MKRCPECQSLTENGDKHCQKCGAPFPYDPKISPYSETKIAIILILCAVIAVVILKSRPMALPDPSTCSLTSYNRFRSIIVQSHQDAMNILAENYISSKELSEIMQLKRTAEGIEVPACLETSKQLFVDYLNELYYTAVLSAWGAYEAGTVRVQNAASLIDQLNLSLAEVRDCLPDCSAMP